MKSSGRPTIRDVATRAGVSPMSVSRVLNNGGTSPETRMRVRRAIDELKFVPNSAAKRLAERQQSPVIAFLFGASNAAVLGEMVGTGFAEAVSSSAELVFVKVPADREPAKIRNTLSNLGIEGVILSPPLCDNPRLLRALSESGVRIVAIGTDNRDSPHSTIAAGNRLAAYEGTAATRAMIRWAIHQLVHELSAIRRGDEPEVRKLVLHRVIPQANCGAPPASRYVVRLMNRRTWQSRRAI